MENQINIGDQNAQQIGQNPVGQNAPFPEKPIINYWMISTIVLAVILAIGGFFGIGMIKQTTKKSPTVQQNPTISPSNQKTLVSPTNQPIGTSPTAQVLTGETIQIKARNPYYLDEIKAYIYKFSFNKNPGDIVKSLPAASWQGEGYSSGIQIARGGAELTISPTFEGVSVPYYDIKPEVVEISPTKISSKPIYRIKGQDSGVDYTYVSYYSEDCKQWEPLPVACHLSNVDSEKVGGLEISCKATSSSVIECDNLLKNIDIIVTEL